MATIRPSIYIGLGGTGIQAISKAKKMYEDAYGKDNIPKWIAFAAIDFNLEMVNDPNLATDMRDDFIHLRGIGSPIKLYENQKKEGEYNWMFPTNSGYLPPRVIDGAGQVRTNGRFLTEMIVQSIENRIKNLQTQIKAITNSGNIRIAQTNSKIEFHIAMSLAGGTGCGSFLNVAQIIKDNFDDDAYIIGYGVLHGIFRTMDVQGNKSSKVVANAYSAILDLDYIMHATPDNPIKVSLNGKEQQLTTPLYDEFYVIDNETEQGDCVDDLSKLCEVIGTCLYVAGNEMGSAIQGVLSNKYWRRTDEFDHNSKKGWVQALGACQVVYKGDLLAEIYELKAAQELIRKLQQKNTDIQQKAIEWTIQANIREDGSQFNLLTDDIYPPNKINSIREPILESRDSITEIKASVNKYLNILPEFPDDENIENRAKEIIKDLRNKVDGLLNSESGVGNALGFITALEKTLINFKNEMDNEWSTFDKRQQEAFTALDKKYREYEDYTKKLFARKKEENLAEMIGKPAQKILKDKLEAARRKAAYLVFSDILNEVDVIKSYVEKLHKKLDKLNSDYVSILDQKLNTTESTLVFEIDLSTKQKLTVKFDSTKIEVPSYITSIGKSLIEVELGKELDKTIRAYVSELPEAVEFRNKLIFDVIENLTTEEYEDLKKEIEKKSSRLLKLDNRGLKNKVLNRFPLEQLVQNYLISIYKPSDTSGFKQSRFEGDSNFMRGAGVPPQYLNSDFSSMRQKIIFYRSDFSIIPYCIKTFDDNTVEKEYNRLIQSSVQQNTTSFNPHFDENLFEEMRSKDFKLKPEMQNEAMLYWICGSLFGWQTVKESKYIMQKDSNGSPVKIDGREDIEHYKYIRINKGKYFYWDENGESRGLDGKWLTINNSSQRDQAFMFFKTLVFPKIKSTLQNKISKDVKANGLEFYNALIDSIVKAGKFDYIDTLVCSDKNSLTYYSQAKGEDKQFDEEWRFIEKNLKNALSNL